MWHPASLMAPLLNLRALGYSVKPSLPPPQQPHIQPVAEPAHGEDVAVHAHEPDHVGGSAAHFLKTFHSLRSNSTD